MSMSDPIADFLTRIRNANMAHHESVEAPASKMKKDIAEILKQEGFYAMLNMLMTTSKASSVYS